jgi:dolichol-phosphate mannosyltransferase
MNGPARPVPSARGQGLATVWVVLPAYEEEGGLPPLLEDFRETFAAWSDAPPWRVVVVDDGSRDGTAGAAESVAGVPLTVLRHPRNLGLGRAMRTGIEHVLSRAGDDDLLATMDADHTHPPDLLPRMVALARGGADVVIASRYRKGSEIHGLVAWRRALSDVASWVFRVLFPGARDYTCGYRVYRVPLLRWAAARYGRDFLNQQGFSVMVDLLLKVRRKARRIEEVPLVLRYDRKRGPSKMRVLRTIGTTLALLVRRFRGDPRGP